MRRLYTTCFYLALPFIFLRLLWRARNNRAYAQRWAERLGCIKPPAQQHGIWIHAVSMGETLAAIPLVKKLQQRFPKISIVMTNMTPTGAERVKATFGDSVMQYYLPYDVPCALHHFIKQLAPRILIIIETELWPNLLHVTQQHKIPVLLANARLSERSFKGYQKIASLTHEMLQNLTAIAVQTQVEADRFIALGLDPARIQVTGSIKFDLEIPTDLVERANTLRAQWGNNRPVFIAASTHEGEEEIILDAFALLRKSLPQLLLVLVPRHLERFNKVAHLCKQHKLEIVLRSEQRDCTANTAVFLGDSMGELLLFYAASDIAFVGGSLVAVGGHNPLEPAALGVPVIMGPQVFNFAAICEQLKNKGALIQIEDSKTLAAAVLEILNNNMQRQKMIEQGKIFVMQNRGALQKHVEIVERMLG